MKFSFNFPVVVDSLIYFAPSLALQSHDEEERAACFAFIVFLMFSWCFVIVSLLWLFLTMTWVDLQYVIVAISDHRTYIRFAPPADGHVFLLVSVANIIPPKI